MIVKDFPSAYFKYENMAIWEIRGLEEFFSAHEQMEEIFEKEYGFPYAERNSRTGTLRDTDIQVVGRLLDQFGDKHFFVFSSGDSNHQALMNLQDRKIIHFGIDIHVIHPKNIYVLEMDKSQDLKIYDTV